MHASSQKIASVLLILIIGIQYGYGQAFEVGIDRTEKNKPIKTNQNTRLEADEPLKLPFWDDFSWSTLVPDTTLWVQDSIGMVEISATNGINPPTFNVAVFDGVKLNGTPYSFSFGDFESGDTDILTSQPIDLSGLTATEKNTVFLSFFYQKQGNGELPDDEDGLRIEFLSLTDTITTWKIVIAPNIIKGSEVLDTDFYQHIHQVTEDEYFHKYFQFRIISTGRQTGPFDTWNIDYVYLNKGRNKSNTIYLDRSFTVPPSSPFKNFTSLPITHFLPIQDDIATPIYSHFNALGDVQVFNFDLEAHISYEIDSSNFEYLNVMDTTNALISNQSNIQVISDSVVDFSGISNNAISASIKLKLFGDLQEDEIPNKPYNTLVNDTIYSTYYLKDYYAYDDGTAEKGAGVNSEGDNIVVQFPFLGSDSSLLKGVYMYFPQVVGEAQHGKRIKINVWSNGSNGPDALLDSRFLTIPKIDALNDFHQVEFANPVVVPDTFYIGWEQVSSDRVFIGLDKNINSQDKIWLNTTGEWEPNNNQIVGSLMLRPYFEENAIITAIDRYDDQPTTIYPNPSLRFFKFDTQENVKLSVINISGQQIHPITRKENGTTILDFESYPSGIYIIKFIDNEKIRAQRILLTK